jgi:16S rRNA (guanine527-N7)-methyltransferase
MINSSQNLLTTLQEISANKNVSRETISNLEEFTDLLLKWNQKINLVSKKINREELWQRHIFDSAQLAKHIPDDKSSIIDFGSGAGFPGLILAMIGNYKVTLVESDQRKCAFLQEAAAKFSLNVKIVNCRIEDVKPSNYDIITSRALAPLNKLLEYSLPFLKKDNFMLFLKGQNVVEEIRDASICWKFDYNFTESAININGGILKIYNLEKL